MWARVGDLVGALDIPPEPDADNLASKDNMNRISVLSLLALTTLGISVASSPVSAQKMGKEKTTMVGGAAMYPSKNIIQNAVNSKDHTTLVAAVKAAGLVDTLQSAGPFTVFAPTNTAFEKLPAGTVDSLLKPEMKDTLVKVLTYHVVSGRYSAADLMGLVKKGKGMASLKTVQGGSLTVKNKGKKLILTDAKGGVSAISISNVNQSNGVIHVVDSVLLPG